MEIFNKITSSNPITNDIYEDEGTDSENQN